MTRNTRLTCLIALIGLSGFVYACGSSSGGGGGGGTSGTANNSSNAGSNSSNAGSNSSNAGSNNGSNGGSNNSGGGASNSGGSNSMGCDPSDPTGMGDECPELVECGQTLCATEYEECFGPDYLNGNFAGECAPYVECASACDCDQTCIDACDFSDCQACVTGGSLASCIANNCLDEAFACSGNGSGGAGGAGGAGNVDPGNGGTAGIPGLSDATCEDLAACCATLGDTKATCDAIVMQGVDLICGTALPGFCP
jgi:hypothetical protein